MPSLPGELSRRPGRTTRRGSAQQQHFVPGLLADSHRRDPAERPASPSRTALRGSPGSCSGYPLGKDAETEAEQWVCGAGGGTQRARLPRLGHEGVRRPSPPREPRRCGHLVRGRLGRVRPGASEPAAGRRRSRTRPAPSTSTCSSSPSSAAPSSSRSVATSAATGRCAAAGSPGWCCSRPSRRYPLNVALADVPVVEQAAQPGTAAWPRYSQRPHR